MIFLQLLATLASIRQGLVEKKQNDGISYRGSHEKSEEGTSLFHSRWNEFQDSKVEQGFSSDLRRQRYGSSKANEMR